MRICAAHEPLLPALGFFAVVGSTKTTADTLPRFDRTLQLESKAETSANVSFGDVDGDGDLDIVISNDEPDPKLVYLNDGKGNFARARVTVSHSGPLAMQRLLI